MTRSPDCLQLFVSINCFYWKNTWPHWWVCYLGSSIGPTCDPALWLNIAIKSTRRMITPYKNMLQLSLIMEEFQHACMAVQNMTKRGFALIRAVVIHVIKVTFSEALGLRSRLASRGVYSALRSIPVRSRCVHMSSSRRCSQLNIFAMPNR